MTVLTEGLLAPAEAGRRALMRVLLRQATLRSILVSKDRRVAAQATVGVLVTFALACVFPALLLAGSPVLLGVPHVASDLRYLVLRPALPRAWVATVVAACAALFAVQVAAAVADGSRLLTLVEGALSLAWIGAGVVMGAGLSGRWRRLLWLAPVLAVGALAAARPAAARMIFAHLHNVLGLAIWILLFRRRRAAAALPVAVVAGATALILAGATLPLVAPRGGSGAFGLVLGEAAARLSPLASGDLSLRLCVAFAFLQSVHYAVWLGWIPQESIRGEGTLTFRMSAASLRADFGRGGLAAVVAVTLVVVAGAVVDVQRARTLYLSLASFHSVLEVAALGFLAAAGRPAARRP
jgi:hypothetical protein